MSAHRTPARHARVRPTSAAGRGLRVIIAGAGGAAHLPGMVASLTPLPVIGVPVPLKHLDGLDSLLSIVQMPAGVPVATVSIGGARNAGLLAVRILAAADPALLERVRRLPAGAGATRRATRTRRCRSAAAAEPPALTCAVRRDGLGRAATRALGGRDGPGPAGSAGGHGSGARAGSAAGPGAAICVLWRRDTPCVSVAPTAVRSRRGGPRRPCGCAGAIYVPGPRQRRTERAPRA